MKIIILAGGKGNRLFPLSRENYPKQFLSLSNNKSLLQLTFERALDIVKNPADIIISTNDKYLPLIQQQLKQIASELPIIISEPDSKNTAPAIALSIKYLLDRLKVSVKEEVIVFPADHLIYPIDNYKQRILESLPYIRRGFFITYGIPPNRPETGYGYIRLGKALDKNIFYVENFFEKPSLDKAKAFIKSGNYLWNMGIFSFSIERILNDFYKFLPEIFNFISSLDYEDFKLNFSKLPNISIDYGILEKTSNILAVKMEDIVWSDIGSWDSIYEVLDKDKNGNAATVPVVTINSSNNLFFSKNKKKYIGGIDVNNLLVIDTEDFLLLIARGSSQKVRDLVSILKKDQDTKRILDNPIENYKPWGYYKVIDSEDGFLVKKLVINPGEAISLQTHKYRNEHWIIVKGIGKVIVEDEEGVLQEKEVKPNDNVFIPANKKHRIINIGKEPLKLIEVQTGAILSEDDIIRHEDNYNRC